VNRSPGEELYLVLLNELRRLDSDLRVELGRSVEGRAPWDVLPPGIRAAFEEWADLLGPAP